MQLEVCVDNADGLVLCVKAGVIRVELCSALELGGLTPSSGLIKFARNLPLDARVLIRPRSGNFHFSGNELALMCDDVAYAAEVGVEGVVLGATDKHSRLDISALDRLCQSAGPLSKTLHRVIDTLENPLDAMEQAIDLGFDTILTSGGKLCVGDGVNLLEKLHKQANGRIVIMAGAGLRPSMISSIHQQTGITAFHSSCTQTEPTDDDDVLVSLGFGATQKRCTNARIINEYQLALKTVL